MAIVITDNKHYQDIASKIRECKGTTETMLPREMPDKVEEVYEAGKQAQYDEFWDVYQDYGKRTSYWGGFTSGWSDDNFKPKYPIIATENSYMFIYTKITNVNVDLDFTTAATMANTFAYAYGIKYIKKIMIKADGSTSMTNPFVGANNLIEIYEIEGLIGKSISMTASSKLSAETAKRIIEHLVNYTGTEKEGAYSIKLHENVWSALNATYTPPNEDTWELYVQNVLGWST